MNKNEINCYQSQVQKDVDEFTEEFTGKNMEWVKQRRLLFLYGRFKELSAEYIRLAGVEGRYSKNDYAIVEEFISGLLKGISKEISKIDIEIKMYSVPKFSESGAGKIDAEMIEKARGYPISDLLDINKRGFAECLWHDDNDPSMYCRNNYAYCFTCGKSGDAIDIYMELNNCDFNEAIRVLA